MVPERIDADKTQSGDEVTICRPRLVLKDISSKPSSRKRSRRILVRRLEGIFAFSATVSVLLFFAVGAVVSLFHTVQKSYFPSAVPTQVMITKMVIPGDTLSQFAVRYGDPAVYLPEREEQIARLNHLSGTKPLLPGQHLLIPVTNPLMIAQIEKSYHNTRLAAR